MNIKNRQAVFTDNL